MNQSVIVLVIPTLHGGGAERVVLTLAREFARQGCMVHIICLINNTIAFKLDQQNINIHIHHFSRYYRWIPRKLRGWILAPFLDRFIMQQCGRPNLVLSNLDHSDLILCHSQLNAYLVIHSTMSQDNTLLQSKKIYTKKPVICVSQGVLQDFKTQVSTRYPPDCIYNAVDTHIVKAQADAFIPQYKNYLVHVGALKSAKAHDVLIKAYHKSGISHPLVLVGRGYRQKKCQALVKKLGLSEKVIFVGFQKNPYPYIKNAMLMVSSSNYEGFGMVIIESLALKTPVISTDCPSGPAEILPHHHLVAVGDIDALAQKMADATHHPEKYMARLKEDFFVENQVKKYLTLTKF